MRAFGVVTAAWPSADRTEGAMPLGGSAKRPFDVLVAAAGLVLIAPLLLVFCLAVRLQDGGPMFYSHARLGYGGRSFRCLKLRTMVGDGDAVLARHLAQNPRARAEWEATRKLRNDPRVTRLGRFLRKTSLDEVPQLINIVRGEMALVGPRPITAAELVQYGPAGQHYTATRPGLTGLWQVSGRSDLDFARRVALDTLYVTRWTFLQDLLIVLRTPAAVLQARGSY